MKKVSYIILFILTFSLTAYCQDYYWYNGQKIPLHKGNQLYILYEGSNPAKDSGELRLIENGDISYFGKNNLKWGIVDQKSIDVNNIVYKMPSFLCRDTTKNMFVTHRFYVKLKDYSDLDLLRTFVNRYGAEIEKEGDLPLWYILHSGIDSHYNALELANIFYESGCFSVSEPEFINATQIECVNDVLFNQQWNLENTGQLVYGYPDIDINYCAAHAVTTGKSSITIGIYDLGVDLTHPDINLSSFSYDVHTLTSPSKIYTINGNNYHGTACAGIISAKTNNNTGVAGIIPDSPIIPLSYSDNTSTYNIGLGFKVAADNGCSVISNSWHRLSKSQWIDECISYALTTGRQGKGCVVVFSAGNENRDSVNYPANTNDSIIVVGAMSFCGERCNPYSCDGENWGSNYGNKLDIMAPGVTIHTTDIVGNEGRNATDYMNNFNGTSAACPHVASVAGLILSVNPNLTSKEVADIIESTAKKIGTGYDSLRLNGTWSYYFGYGLVDAYAAVVEAKDRYDRFIQGPDYVCDTTKYYLIHPSQTGDTVTWSVSNGVLQYPHYSIVGPANQDTVYVRCERMTPVTPPNPPDYLNGGGRSLYDQKLMVTISNGTTKTYEKLFREPQGETPVISASNSSTQWRSGSRRTFTISNCSSTPDNALRWEVRKIVMPFFGNIDTTFTYYTGRTLSYRAPSVTGIAQLRITAINTQKECDPNYASLDFLVSSAFSLNAYTDNGTLQVDINEQDEETRSVESSLNKANTYSLELWHNIYGCMRSQTVQSMQVQMDISGLPQGVYVLLLKENGNVIADTKVPL